MKKGEFINVSKRMVKEYFNRYIDNPGDIRKITSKDVVVIDFRDEPNVYRVILVTMTSESLFYGVTYYKDTDEIHSYIYEKIEDRIKGRKEIFNGRR